MMETFPTLVRVGGARPPVSTIFTITYKVAVYALAERADTLTLSHLYLYELCGGGDITGVEGIDTVQ
jgi:hypothetical protein